LNFASLVFIGFTSVIVHVEQNARKQYLEDCNSYKVSLDMIQALILLKTVSTNKEIKKYMEGGNIPEVTETPTVIVFVSFFGNSTIKDRFGNQSSAY